MNAHYAEKYQELQTALSKPGPAQNCPLAEIQFRFQLGFQHSMRLPLPNCPIDAVEYFKEWKPRFLSEYKYYQLLYHAETFRPTGDMEARKSFWVRESNRLTRQIEEEPELYAYYRDRDTRRDEELFGQASEKAEQHARIWADFIALERYKQYLDNEFQRFLYRNA